MAWAKAYGHKLAQGYCAAGLKPKAMAMAQAPSWAMAQDPGNVAYAYCELCDLLTLLYLLTG